MANGDHCVLPRSRKQIEAFATVIRDELGVSRRGRISMQPILEFALDSLVENAFFTVEEDGKMGGAEGRTDGQLPIITLSAGTYMKLQRNDPRARWTVAHELGYMLMHCGQRVFHFPSAKMGRNFDPEWQADEFAAAFLMPASHFGRMRSVSEAMQTFGVSRAAAMRRARMLKIGMSHHGEFRHPVKKKERNMRRAP